MSYDIRGVSYPHSHWDDCLKHDWEEIDSMFSNEYTADVRCKTCGCPGEQDRETLTTYWPVT
jgi:hypothetical protein